MDRDCMGKLTKESERQKLRKKVSNVDEEYEEKKR